MPRLSGDVVAIRKSAARQFAVLIHAGAARVVPSSLWLLESLLPSRCACCDAPGPTACPACVAALAFLRPPFCALCGAPTAWPVGRCRECSGRRLAFASARAAVRYTGSAPRFVHAWKERGLRPFADRAGELVVERLACPPADVITYIPPDGDRSLKRGYQPAQGLARALGRSWRLEVAPLVARARPVERQTALGRRERRRNMRGAFTARGTPPPHVLLIDDVYTTGATVAAAAAALRAAGARQVDVVTFARAVR